MPVLEIFLALLLAVAGVAVIYALGLRARLAHTREQESVAAALPPPPSAVPVDQGELDRAHGLLDAIYASAPVGLGFWDRELRFVRLNARLAEMNGLPPELHIGKTPKELLPGIVEMEALMEKLREILSGDLTELRIDVSGETPAVPGVERYWSEIFFPVRVGAEIVGVGGVVEEVTERKLAENALRRAHESLSLAQRASGSGVWDWEVGREEVYVSREYRNIYGIPADATVRYETWLDGVHPEDRERVREARNRLFQGGGEWSEEFRIMHPLYAERWVSSQGELIRDAQGRPARFSGITVDITERRRAEAGLRESEERFRWIVQRAPIPVFVHALDGEILAMSRAVTELAGWTRDDLPDARAWYTKGRGVPPDQLEMMDEELRRRFAANEPVEPEVVVWTKQGEQRKWLFHRSEVKRLADGRPFLTSMAIDITEREKADEALRDADRRKDEFLAMLAHELRNPLAPIRNAVELLKTSPGVAADTAALTQMLERQLSHLVRLVDDLLDVSRVTRGKIELKRQVTDLREVTRHAIEVVQPMLAERGQTLDLSAPASAASVHADPTRLVQVMLNLLTNASKFSPEGSRITLQLERASGEWILRVADRGQGIAPELLPRVFDLFTQGERSLDRTEGGLGIGLSLVNALVEMHGGRVEAHSAGIGHGSEFVVRLPASTEEAVRSQPNPSASVNTTGSPRHRVLAVDDNRDSAESLRMLLELWGHEARCAFDGQEALDVVDAFEPDVVLLDIGLPGMSGYDLAARMREREAPHPVTLIAVTGYGQDEDRRRVRAAGFDHHLVKPVDPDTLERLMNSLEQPAG